MTQTLVGGELCMDGASHPFLADMHQGVKKRWRTADEITEWREKKKKVMLKNDEGLFMIQWNQ